MIKIENIEVIGWEHAIRGMRNPMNSWDKSDSVFFPPMDCTTSDDEIEGCGSFRCYTRPCTMIGENDLDLMTRLRGAGTDHRKFMRMIVVYVDITAPLYWWKEFDTYKVGTVANSCSTMHKIHEKEFTLDDFSCEHLVDLIPEHEYGVTYANCLGLLEHTMGHLNFWRKKFIEMPEKGGANGLTKKDVWWQLIQLLPSSYNQKRTVMLNYEVLANMYHSRKNHKLDEWRELCSWIEQLPYAKELICNE